MDGIGGEVYHEQKPWGMFMSLNHLVFGSGLIGSYIGVALTLTNQRTLMVARGTWLERIKQGLSLSDVEGHLTSVGHGDVEACVASESTYAADVIWLTVKCTAVASIVSDLQHYVKPHSVIVCCQNGLDSDDDIRRAFPDNTVLRAMVPFNVTIEPDNRLHRGTPGALTIEHNPSAINFNRFVGQFNSPVLDLTLHNDMASVLWSKLQLNMGNAVNALANVPVKTMLENRDYRIVVAGLMEEVIAVAQAKEIKLIKLTAVQATMIPKILKLPTFVFKLVANKMLKIDPTVKTSMWWDLHSGHLTEVEFLYGAVARAGKLTGVSCPLAESICGLIHDAENAFQAQGRFPGVDGKSLREQLGL